MCSPRHAEVRCVKSWLHYCQLRELGSHDNTWQAAGHMGWSRLPLPQEGAGFYAVESSIHTRKVGSGATVQRCAVWLFPFHLSVHLQSDQAPWVMGEKLPTSQFFLQTISTWMCLKIHCGSIYSFIPLLRKKIDKPTTLHQTGGWGYERGHDPVLEKPSLSGKPTCG